MNIPPPVFFLATAIVMGLVGRWLPGPVLLAPGLRPLGWIVVAAGGALAGVAVARMRVLGTTVRPDREPSRLVTDGPWRWSRNPIYLGLTLVLVGGAAFAGTLGPLIVLWIFPLLIDRLRIPAEEETLARLFGAEWEAYRARVRRWL